MEGKSPKKSQESQKVPPERCVCKYIKSGPVGFTCEQTTFALPPGCQFSENRKTPSEKQVKDTSESSGTSTGTSTGKNCNFPNGVVCQPGNICLFEKKPDKKWYE